MSSLKPKACSFQTPVARFKANQGQTCQSPLLKMPASPLLERLGYGTGVSVYLVERSPRHGQLRSPWAVKKVNKTKHRNRSDIYAKRLKEEANILKSLDHKNIVGYRGLTKAKDGMLCLALEDAEKDLFSIIEERMENDEGPFPSQHIMRVAEDIAEALEYLHIEKNLLHGDIKSGNILIKGEFSIAKLCDFGVTLKLDENLQAPSSKHVGTECWNAKEAMDKGGVVSDKTDMYSYGLVIYEMLTLNIPHMDVFPNEEDFPTEAEFEAAFVEAELDQSSLIGTRPYLPDINYNKSYQDPIALFYACSDENPKKRPSAKLVLISLRTCVGTEQIQCKLDFEELS